MNIPNVALDHDYFKYYTWKDRVNILDLGATVGELGLIYRNNILQYNNTYIAVEPSSFSVSLLSKNMNDFLPNNSRVLQLGVGGKNEIRSFNISDNFWSSSVETPSNDVKIMQRSIINLVSLDTLFDIFGKIDFVKADIEGSEIETFCSSGNLLAADNYAIAAYHIVDGQETWKTLKPLFESGGFRVTVEAVPYGNFPAYTMLYASKYYGIKN